jgi:uncharacterized membrane protein YeiH
MMTFDSLIFALEMIGTAAFAVSGVMVARERKMDLFGAILLGCATAVGGGVFRDLLLGITPPVMFLKPIYSEVAVAACLVQFLLEKRAERRKPREKTHLRTEFVLNVADSVGLAAFVVVGCRTAVNAGFADNQFLTIFVGTVTGIGGGILRDMMAGQMPLIFRRRVYGIAAIAGAIAYTFFPSSGGSVVPAAFLSMAVTVTIRFLAIHYRWNLPSFR